MTIDETSRLNSSERTFVDKQISLERYYFYFCLLDILVATGIIITILFIEPFNSTRFVLSIVLLLNARSNLKHYKMIKIVKKTNVTG